jgi:hypothetical protein
VIEVKIQGLQATVTALGEKSRQLPFATARALTVTAHQVHRAIIDKMQSGIAGGATPYTLRAFAVTAATKQTLTATVGLKTPAQTQGTPYQQSISHLFNAGTRRFKRLEGWLSANNILPDGLQLVPGPGLRVDSRGNARQADLKEMIGILSAFRRNLKSFRKGRGNKVNEVGFFVVRPGDPAARNLHPGIYRRIDPQGAASLIACWFHFVKPTAYRQQFNLDKIAATVVNTNWYGNFSDSLAKSLSTAK